MRETLQHWSSERSSNSRSTHGVRRWNISWAETRSTPPGAWSQTNDEGSPGGNNSTPKKMVNDTTRRGTLEKVTRRVIPLSGKKNYFWYRDHWNSLYQPEANHNQSFDGVRKNDILGQNGWCGLPCWRQHKGWFWLSPEMDGTHGKSTSEDNPEQQWLRKATHGKLAHWRCKLGTKCKC